MQSKRGLVTLALLVLSTGAQAQEKGNTPVQKVFKNWQVTCNNLNDCDVRNMDEGLRIIITRQAGETGKATLVFQALADQKPAGIWLDGKPWHSDIVMAPAGEKQDFGGGSTDRLSDIQQWVQASKNALEVSVTADPQQGAASLSGLNAALLLVDDRQGRLNNQTALLKVGNNEPDSVPARPAAPVLNFTPPAVVPLTNAAALIDAAIAANAPLLAAQYCEQDRATRAASSAQPLNDTQALVLLNCGMGAYQSSSLLFISARANPQDTRQLTLTVPLTDEHGSPQIESMFTEADYDPKTGALFFSGRGRGLADCGENGGWKYDGKTFHLSSYNSQPHCNGGEPGDWPSVWTSAEAQ